jgi:hypothetical protein
VAKLSGITTPSLTFDEGAAPSTPAANDVILYAKTDGLLYSKDDAGAETAVSGGAAAFAGVRAVANAVTSLTTATWTAIALAGTDRFDTDAFHDPASNNTRLTVPSGKAGKYLIGAQGSFAANVTGQRGLRIILNGATVIAGELNDATNDAALPTRITTVTLYDLAVADYVEMQEWQDSGGSINSQNDANYTCEFWMYRVG